MEAAFLAMCQSCKVDPEQLLYRINWRVDEGQPAEIMQLSAGELKVLKACLEVAGGF